MSEPSQLPYYGWQEPTALLRAQKAALLRKLMAIALSSTQQSYNFNAWGNATPKANPPANHVFAILAFEALHRLVYSTRCERS